MRRALLFAALAGCTADLGGKCETAGDCDDGLACREGYCLPPEAAGDAGPDPDAAARDGGAGDDGAVTPDAGPTPDGAVPADAAPPPDAGPPPPDAATTFCVDPVPRAARQGPGTAPPALVDEPGAATVALWRFDDDFEADVPFGDPPALAGGRVSLNVKPVPGVEGCAAEFPDAIGQRFELDDVPIDQPPFTVSVLVRPRQGSREDQAIVSSVAPKGAVFGREIEGGWELGMAGGPQAFTPYFEWAQRGQGLLRTVRARFPVTIPADAWSSVELFVGGSRAYLAVDGRWSCVDAVSLTGGAAVPIDIAPPRHRRQALGGRPDEVDQPEARLAGRLDELHLLSGRVGGPPAVQACGEVIAGP